MNQENLSHKCRPVGHCNTLLEKLESAVIDYEIRLTILELGDTKCNTADSYRALRKYLFTNFRHQTLIAMAEIEYYSAIDIIIGLLRRERNREQNENTVDALACIFTERIDYAGPEKFLSELDNFSTLELNLRGKFYNALRDGVQLSSVRDIEDYLKKARSILSI